MKRTETILLSLGIVIAVFSACVPVTLILLFNFQDNVYDRFEDISTRIGRIEGRLQIPVPDDVDAEPVSLTADSLGIAVRVSDTHPD